MLQFTISKFMKQPRTADCIYQKNGHIAFNALVKSLVADLDFIITRTYSRPGATQHNIKLCGVWPSTFACRAIWEGLTAQYPDYTITLSFNADPDKPSYNSSYNGLVAAISTFHTSEHKAYVCPHDAYADVRVIREAAEVQRREAREAHALQQRNTLAQEDVAHRASIDRSVLVNDITLSDIDMILAIRSKRESLALMESAVDNSVFSADVNNMMRRELSKAWDFIAQIDMLR